MLLESEIMSLQALTEDGLYEGEHTFKLKVDAPPTLHPVHVTNSFGHAVSAMKQQFQRSLNPLTGRLREPVIVLTTQDSICK